jgi:hypothetical protein
VRGRVHTLSAAHPTDLRPRGAFAFIGKKSSQHLFQAPVLAQAQQLDVKVFRAARAFRLVLQVLEMLGALEAVLCGTVTIFYGSGSGYDF